LENDLHPSAESPQIRPALASHILSRESHTAAGRLDQPQQTAADGRLTAAALADQP
jgi:hypothetical protein